MKTSMALFTFLLLSSQAYGKIISVENKVYLRNEGKQVPLTLVNTMIAEKKISKVRLFGDGEVNLISFSKKGEKEKLYSVDEKGFVYAIEPFASYNVRNIVSGGQIVFKEAPTRKYRIDNNGYFLH